MNGELEAFNAGRIRRLPRSRGDATAILGGAEAMLEALIDAPVAALRWYVPTETAIVLGASQKDGVIDWDACETQDIRVYRRVAGGATVLLTPSLLGLDIVLPREHPLLVSDLTASYRWLGQAWLETFRSLDIPGEIVQVPEARASAQEQGREAELARLSCYGSLSPYEVTVNARKVVGFAQVRRRHGALFQVGVLMQWNPEQLASLLSVSTEDRGLLIKGLSTRIACLDDVRSQLPETETIISRFEESLTSQGLQVNESRLTPSEEALTVRICAEQYKPLARPI